MVLLTSSQVSIALSSAIVISCTTALFLSGYVIQQRTVGHLRAAIRPNPSHQIFIPDRFRQDTTELTDGTIVVLDEYDRPTRQRVSVPPGPEGRNHAVHESENGENGEVAVDVKDALAASPDEQQQQRVLAIEKLRQETEDAEVKEHQEAHQPPAEAQPQPAPWEMRVEGEQTPDGSTEHPEDDSKKPVSRAERRRLIKEEIMRLAQGDEPVYYQRRLW